jgi:hypothetical protein
MSESDYLIELLNIYALYYKNAFNEKNGFFGDIDYDNEASTTKMMEFVFEHMMIYKKKINKRDLINPQEIDIKNYEKLYVLYIDSKQKYCCELLMPILINLVDSDWKNINWFIHELK